MKLRVLMMALIGVAVFLISTTIDAASGDLNVNGQLSVGEGGVKFPDGSIQTTAISPTIQRDVTSSRALGTVYQNTSGNPMFVAITVTHFTLRGTITALTDSSSTPTRMIGGMSNDPYLYSFVCFWVLPGNYYKVIHDHPISLTAWIESY